MSRTRKPARERLIALAYVRVSTSMQAEEGASLDSQRAMLTAEAQRRGWDVEIVADEGLSAKNIAQRPALVDALARLDRGEADVLLALSVDRLSRSVADFARLIEQAQRRKWSLVALDLGLDTSTPSGELMANMLASIAQYQRKLTGLRTREGMAQRRSEGVHLGRVSVLDERVVRRVVKAHERGDSLAAIARKLTADGVPTATGKTWHPSTISRVLTSTAAERIRARAGR